MAKFRGRTNELYVGLTNPPTTKLLSKKDLKVDGPKQVRVDTTTDDSAGPEHEVIFANEITSITCSVLMDEADPSYQLVRNAAEAGTKIYVSWRPNGTASGTKREHIFQATVDMKPDESTMDMARADVTFMKSGGVTSQNQP